MILNVIAVIIDKAIDILLSSNTFITSDADGYSCLLTVEKGLILQLEELRVKSLDEITCEVLVIWRYLRVDLLCRYQWSIYLLFLWSKGYCSRQFL